LAKPWVVYAKRPCAGPEQVLEYLGRYTHRTAISNERLLCAEGDFVRFRYKDYAHGDRRKLMQLQATEFLRRFALHVLPRGFNRIRHYGLLANRNKRALLARARAALCAPAPSASITESLSTFWQRIAGINIERCPRCHIGTLRLVAAVPAATHPPP
jgi:Putative transposase